MRGFNMISRRQALAITVLSLIGGSTAALAQAKEKSSPATRLDTDHDSTVDIDEAKKAASDLFDKLDTDKEGTLSIKELGGRLSSKDLIARAQPLPPFPASMTQPRIDLTVPIRFSLR